MIQKRIDAIEAKDIDLLIANEVPESQTLDYKEKLNLNTDDEKREFLHDISSFANASGGDLIIGVREKLDEKGAKTGLPGEVLGINANEIDALLLKIEEFTKIGIDPRINTIGIRRINGYSQGCVLVIRIPQSFSSPHMVTYKGSTRFYSRNSAGKYLLDVRQIRDAFLSNNSIAATINGFRNDRLASIVAGQTPIPLSENPKIVLHVLPLESFVSRRTLNIEISDIYARPLSDHFNYARRNIDGFITCRLHDQKSSMSYLQVFRDGRLEAVDTYLIDTNGSGRESIPIQSIEESLIISLQKYLEMLKGQDVNPPIFVAISFIGVKGLFIPDRRRAFADEQVPFDRDHLWLPEERIDDLSIPADVILQPMLNLLWQASGYERDFYYSQTTGRWIVGGRQLLKSPEAS